MNGFYRVAFLVVALACPTFADFALSFNPADYLESSIGQYGNFRYKILSTGSVQRNYNGQIGGFGNIQVQRSYNGKVSQIGDVTFVYSYNGKATQIGDYHLSYNAMGKLISIGDINISYAYKGQVISVGNCTISYTYNGEVSAINGDVGDGMSITVF